VSKTLGPKEIALREQRESRFASAKVSAKPIAELRKAVDEIPVKRKRGRPKKVVE
jgi:hypothetical protein